MSETENSPPRLKNYYDQEIAPALLKEFKLENKMQVPRLEKIVINMGLGEAIQNPKALEYAVAALASNAARAPASRGAPARIAARAGPNVGVGAHITPAA